MKRDDEFGVRVNNPDGSTPIASNDGKSAYTNDTRRAVQENPSQSVKEISSYDERLVFGKQKPVETTQATGMASGAGESASAATGSLVSRGVQAVTHGLGGVGALLGVVGASVGAAAVVVAYVALAFSVNVALFASSCHSLTFLLTIENEENKPLVAILSGEEYRDERILAGEAYLTYEDLQAGGEYVLTVKNQDTDEVYFRQSFRTPAEVDERAQIFDAYVEGSTLSFFVTAEGLAEGDFYTVTVLCDGKSLFAFDETETERFYELAFPEDGTTALLSVRMGRSVVAYMEVSRPVEPEVLPSYDYANAVWSWSGTEAVSAIVPDTNGGDPLVLTPEILSETELAATCEEEGRIRYYAVIEDEDENTYFDEKTVVVEPLGHDYADPEFEWVATATGYDVTAIFTCAHDADHKNHVATTVTKKIVSATCTADGAATYVAAVTLGGVDYDDERIDVLTATGHTLGELYEEIPATCEENGMKAHYCCEICGKFLDENGDETAEEDLLIAATGHTLGDLYEEIPATCEETGMLTHYCCEICEKFFDENGDETTEDDLIIAALGHDYGTPSWSWAEDGLGGYTATAHFGCTRCDHEEEEAATVTLTNTTAPDCGTETNGSYAYSASVTFNDQAYDDEKVDTIPYEHTVETEAEYTFPEELTGIDYATGELPETVYATYTCTTCGHTVQVACETSLTITGDGPMYLLSVGGQENEYLLSFTDAELEYSYDEENDCFSVCGIASNDQSGSQPSDPEPVTTVTIPTSFYGKPVTGISSYAFGGSDVSTLTVGSHITHIDEYAFSGAFNLETVVLPGVDVPAYAFDGDSGLTSVTIASGATSIGEGAFDGCSSLTELTIPDTVISIGQGAFTRMSSLETLTVPFIGSSASSAVASEETLLGYWFVGDAANYGGFTQITQGYSMETGDEYYIPDSLTTITITGGKVLFGALMNCSNVTTITLGEGVDTIETWAFFGCDESASVSVSCGENEVWKVYDSEDELKHTYTAADLTSGTQNLQLLLEGTEYEYVWRKTTE